MHHFPREANPDRHLGDPHSHTFRSMGAQLDTQTNDFGLESIIQYSLQHGHIQVHPCSRYERPLPHIDVSMLDFLVRCV